MNRLGTAEQARNLAERRWSQFFAFDLAAETWDSLFSAYDPRDILQAITNAKTSYSRDPAVVYKWFEQSLKTLAENRNLTWPPSGINRN
jgi:hypothetical protein